MPIRYVILGSYEEYNEVCDHYKLPRKEAIFLYSKSDMPRIFRLGGGFCIIVMPTFMDSKDRDEVMANVRYRQWRPGIIRN